LPIRRSASGSSQLRSTGGATLARAAETFARAASRSPRVVVVPLRLARLGQRRRRRSSVSALPVAPSRSRARLWPAAASLQTRACRA
jgi:hypothetical protein